MLAAERFEKARQFIYRNGDLLTRKRFAYHFEDGPKGRVLGVLTCYQNDDGGFGNGLEKDLMCPESSGIALEIALGHLLELGVASGPSLDRALTWVHAHQTDNGDLPHPAEEAIKAYPHGPWWAKDSGRILSVAGLLGRMGITDHQIRERAAAVFRETYASQLGEIGVYSYPIALYLWHAGGAALFPEAAEQLAAVVPKMLKTDAWHHPLVLCHNRWQGPDIPEDLWRSEAKRVMEAFQDDGGIFIERYSGLPWWRPVWTLDTLVIMKEKGLLDSRA